MRSTDDWVTGQIIGAFYEVYNELGYGFLESVYAAALEIEFQLRGVPHVREQQLDVYYKGRVAHRSRSDFLVDGDIVVELKATRLLT
ncbi:MAG: GxxExxY protein, partial [bacterium]